MSNKVREWDIKTVKDNYTLVAGNIYRKRDGKKVKFHIDSSGYSIGSCCGHPIKEHRFVWLLHYGYIPTIIDHINGIKTDNRIENLREVTLRENQHNRKSHREGKPLGVYTSTSGKYHVAILIDGKLRDIGPYVSKEKAAEAYRGADNNRHLCTGTAKEFKEELLRKGLIPKLEYSYKGYSYHKRDKVYQPKILVDGVYLYLGSFQTEKEAYDVYHRALDCRELNKTREAFLSAWNSGDSKRKHLTNEKQ